MYVSASTFAERLPTSSAISAHVLRCAWSSEIRRCLRSWGDQSGVPVARHARAIAVRRPVDFTPGKQGAGEVAIVAGRERSLDRLRERGG